MSNKLTRRQLISGAAGIGALAAAGTYFGSHWSSTPSPSKPTSRANIQSAPCDNGTGFNVILHGLFLIELWDSSKPPDQRIRILSPKTDGSSIQHIYRAGSWARPGEDQKFSDFSGECYSKWDSKEPKSPLIDGLPTMGGLAGHVAYEKSQFSIFLPWPNEVKPLRIVQSPVQYNGITAQFFPQSLALHYNTVPADNSPIPGCTWHKDRNFHIFAEPECKLGCDDVKNHGPEMLRRIQDMFEPPVKFNLQQQAGHECDETPIDDCQHAARVDPKEEKSYDEIFSCGNSTKGAAFTESPFNAHLTLCASMLLTPPAPS